MATGVYVFGKMIGYSETPWNNDPNKFNRKIRLQTGAYVDGFGEEIKDYTDVDISMDRAGELKAHAEHMKGKDVSVRVVFKAVKGGRNGAFLNCFMPKDAQIVEQKGTK